MAKTKSSGILDNSLFNNFCSFNIEGVYKEDFTRVYFHYKNIAINTYRWYGLPNGIESRKIEEFLFNHGQVIFFDDKEFGFMALPCYQNGKLNVYSEPTAYNAIGLGMTRYVKAEDSARILNNDVKLPTAIYVYEFSKKIAELERNIKVNLKHQKFPYVMVCDDKTILSAKNMIKQIENDEFALMIDKNMLDDGKGIEALPTVAPYLVDRFQDQKKEYENDLMEVLGLNTSNTDKKERLLVDEVNSNNGFVEMNLDLGFKARKDAAKIINEKFGLNVRVEKVIESLNPIRGTTIEDKIKDKMNLNGGDGNE